MKPFSKHALIACQALLQALLELEQAISRDDHILLSERVRVNDHPLVPVLFQKAPDRGQSVL